MYIFFDDIYFGSRTKEIQLYKLMMVLHINVMLKYIRSIGEQFGIDYIYLSKIRSEMPGQ